MCARCIQTKGFEAYFPAAESLPVRIPYASVCSLIFGFSYEHERYVVLLVLGAFSVPPPAQAISELYVRPTM